MEFRIRELSDFVIYMWYPDRLRRLLSSWPASYTDTRLKVLRAVQQILGGIVPPENPLPLIFCPVTVLFCPLTPLQHISLREWRFRSSDVPLEASLAESIANNVFTNIPMTESNRSQVEITHSTRASALAYIFDKFFGLCVIKSRWSAASFLWRGMLGLVGSLYLTISNFKVFCNLCIGLTN